MAEVASVVPLPNVAASIVAQRVVRSGIPPGMPGFHVVRRSWGRMVSVTATAVVAGCLQAKRASATQPRVRWMTLPGLIGSNLYTARGAVGCMLFVRGVHRPVQAAHARPVWRAVGRLAQLRGGAGRDRGA